MRVTPEEPLGSTTRLFESPEEQATLLLHAHQVQQLVREAICHVVFARKYISMALSVLM